MRLLIAEDDPILADGLRHTLRQAGHAVDTVKTGPVIPHSSEIWLAPAFNMKRGTLNGWTRFRFLR